MNLALWIVASLLAVVLVFSGSAKLLVTKKKLASVPLGSTSRRFWCRWLLSAWCC